MSQLLYVFIVHFDSLNFSLFDILELHLNMFVIMRFAMMFAEHLRQFIKTIVRKFWHIIMTPIWGYLFQCIIECIDDVLLRCLSIFFYSYTECIHMSICICIFLMIWTFQSWLVWTLPLKPMFQDSPPIRLSILHSLLELMVAIPQICWLVLS